ncbi:MAG: hypothetical protein ABIX01_16620 [Chitinophagaceae bacterium]
MKKLLIISVAATLICSISFAKIWRVNNNAGVVANFTTAQLANDNASVLAGDTIHIEPSITSYGNLTCNKRLTWISTGAFLSSHPNEQFSSNVGSVGTVSTNAGSANSVFQMSIAGNFSVNTTSISIDRCYVSSSIVIDQFASGANNNTVVINSYVGSSIQIFGSNNHIITNNVVGAGFSVSGSNTAATITHNVFNAISTTASAAANSIIENNIFNKATAVANFNNCTVQYNMSGAPNVLPAGNNNQNNIAMASVFVNNSGTTDSDWVLKAGSPAIGAGSNGVDMGAFGGGSPFRLAMQPPVPAIYKIQAPAAPAGNTLNVTFSTKSNN